MEDFVISGIDPGPVSSGYITVKIYSKLKINNACVICYDFIDNYVVADKVVGIYGRSDIIVVEGIANYGNVMGNDIINTGYAIGGFKDRWCTTGKRFDNFGIFTTPEVRASVLGTPKSRATELRSKIKQMWAPILPTELNKDKHKHVISALSIVTHYVIKNIGKGFFE